jgi:regulator of nucleoside diphosphate kinase
MTMESTATAKRNAMPRITLSADDYERLTALVHAAKKGMPELTAELDEELARADVLGRGRYPKHIVRMNSEVEFRDDRTGKIQWITLVYPEEADISRRRVSILTPVGAALIGLRTGASIEWEAPNGETRQLTVLTVRDPRV